MPAKSPSKSWIAVLFLMLSTVILPVIDKPLERCCGIEISEHDVQTMLTAFLGSSAVGAGYAGVKRRETRKLAEANGNGHAPPPPAGGGGADDPAAELRELIDAAKGGAGEQDDEEPPPGKQ